MDNLEKLVLDALTQARPNGIEIESYPQVVGLIINLVVLELTKKQGEEE